MLKYLVLVSLSVLLFTGCSMLPNPASELENKVKNPASLANDLVPDPTSLAIDAMKSEMNEKVTNP